MHHGFAVACLASNFPPEPLRGPRLSLELQVLCSLSGTTGAQIPSKHHRPLSVEGTKPISGVAPCDDVQGEHFFELLGADLGATRPKFLTVVPLGKFLKDVP